MALKSKMGIGITLLLVLAGTVKPPPLRPTMHPGRGEGVTLHTADALVAGTARAHGAILLTDNEADLPVRVLRVVRPLASKKTTPAI